MSVLAQNNELARLVLDAMPVPVLVVDEDVGIVDANTAGVALLGAAPALQPRQHSGELLHCLHVADAPGGCGRGEHCHDCSIRRSVQTSYQGQQLVRQRVNMQVTSGPTARTLEMLITTTPLELDGRRLVLMVLEDITELAALRELVPICAKCKKIRDDRQYWHHLETYLAANLHVQFTHGLCPDCLQEYLRAATMPTPSAHPPLLRPNDPA